MIKQPTIKELQEVKEDLFIIYQFDKEGNKTNLPYIVNIIKLKNLILELSLKGIDFLVYEYDYNNNDVEIFEIETPSRKANKKEIQIFYKKGYNKREIFNKILKQKENI